MINVATRPEIDIALKNIRSTYCDIINERSFLFEGKTQALLQVLMRTRFSSWLETALHTHVLEHAIKAERIAPGSLRGFMVNLVSEDRSQPLIRFGDSRTHQGPSRDDVVRYIANMVPARHQALAQILLDAIDVAGMNGKIIIEKTTRAEHVEHLPGYTFHLTPALVTENVRHVRPFVACADALIEEPCHVDTLFSDVMSSKETCFFFARGFSDSVLATIKGNSLPIIPFAVPVDYETMNTLVDIAVIGGTDVLSHLKGDLLSSLTLENLPQIERIDVSRSGISIFNRVTTSSVRSHLRNLHEKRREESEQTAYLIDGRIRSLTTNTVCVRLLDDHTFIERSQIIDDCLRGIASMITYGTTNSAPALTIDIASMFASDCITSMMVLGAAIMSPSD